MTGALTPERRDLIQAPLPEYVGPYRLIRRLGEGGMGTVYLAERELAGFRQRVALKLLHAGYLVSRVAEQVERERSILARLEHPNIARLIDGGTTPSGQPYLAMEYVEGDTLLDYAHRRALPLRDRLGLFIDICGAVHYAHQQLVVHRDLKPGNVLVDGDGRPRLLDFGIAKLLDPDTADPGVTRSVPWFTPAYASPEQIRGDRVSTLTDVYALGVMLYELLSGARPYRVEGLSPAEMERLASERGLPHPSQRCADSTRARELRGDLDTIVLKAMAYEPERRYASADQLAGDLRRYLEGRPVTARPDSTGYRVAKFVRRHRTAVGLTVTVLLLLVSSVILVTRQAGIARRERDRAVAARTQSEEVTSFLLGLFEGTDPGRAPVDTAVARGLLRQGIAQAEALSGQPLVQASMLDALGMVFVNMTQLDQGDELITRAWNLRTANLAPDHPDLAVSLSHLGLVLRMRGRYEEAEGRLREALAIRRHAFGDDHALVAASYRDLAFLMPYLTRNEEALRYYETALAIDRKVLGPTHPQTADDLGLTAQVLRRLGRLEEGLAVMEQVVLLKSDALGPDHAETARSRFHLGDFLAAVGRTEEAERQHRQGIEARRRALGNDDLRQIHGLGSLASLLSAGGRNDEALALLNKRARIVGSQLGERSTSYAESIESVARELARQGRIAEAEDLHRRGLAIWREALGDDHVAVAGSLTGLSIVLQQAGKLDEAEAMAREGLAIRARVLAPQHGLIGLNHMRIASVLLDQGRVVEAEAEARRALAILEVAVPADSRDMQEARALLARIEDATGHR